MTAYRTPRTVFQLAHAQLDGGVPWGEVVIGTCSLFICQNCGVEYHLGDGLEPCAFCDGCKEEVLGRLADALVRFEKSAPRRGIRGRKVGKPDRRADTRRRDDKRRKRLAR